ncbi:TPA: ABC transporter ATP-binding protein [Streptococcus suis]|uniref:ABC transporter ATP-binding protein n=1 Tax=Streptococcus suis TaxID=1307 RepID=UPI00041C38E0|nr:ABC transporter ATP-binding protein [Streptococcus suis]MCO8202978.1 ABC transporter ATP-binding protein [Streptococcus suis]HEM3502783.1 ABC transporter ATP-binding protein [Streptococcus suis]
MINSSRKKFIHLQSIEKYYGDGENKLKVLKSIDLTVQEGEFVAIMGTSGSGKSTLMNIIGFLDKPSGGTYFFDGNDIHNLSDNNLVEIRNREIGFIFQQFFLLPKLSAIKNVELPLVYSKKSNNVRNKIAREMLQKVNLEERLLHLPSELSGGQKQRVAIARALVNNPSIILADEPTGALDTKTGHQIMSILTQLNREGKTIILVTHDEEVASYATRKIVIRDGEIVLDSRNKIGN